MTDILKCDLCDADAGDDPYHATINGNGHTHICASCFDPQQHDVGVLKQQRDDLLAALKGMVALYDTDEGCRSLPEYQAARDAICREIFRAAAETAKAGGES